MDKQVTRLANMGFKRILRSGRWWDLSAGTWRAVRRECGGVEMKQLDAAEYEDPRWTGGRCVQRNAP